MKQSIFMDLFHKLTNLPYNKPFLCVNIYHASVSFKTFSQRLKKTLAHTAFFVCIFVHNEIVSYSAAQCLT